MNPAMTGSATAELVVMLVATQVDEGPLLVTPIDDGTGVPRVQYPIVPVGTHVMVIGCVKCSVPQNGMSAPPVASASRPVPP